MPSSKRSKSKKARKASSRSAPWHQALEADIVSLVIRPTLARILQSGVESRRDLHRQWEVTTGCSVSTETFSRWLRISGFESLFSQVRLVTAPSTSERPSATGISGSQYNSFERPPPTETPKAARSEKAPFCAVHGVPYNDPNHQPGPECLVNEDATPENEDGKPYNPPSRDMPLEKLAGVFPLPVQQGRGTTVIPAFNAGII